MKFSEMPYERPNLDAVKQQFAGLLGQYDPEQAAEAVAPSGEGEA